MQSCINFSRETGAGVPAQLADLTKLSQVQAALNTMEGDAKPLGADWLWNDHLAPALEACGYTDEDDFGDLRKDLEALGLAHFLEQVPSSVTPRSAGAMRRLIMVLGHTKGRCTSSPASWQLNR